MTTNDLDFHVVTPAGHVTKVLGGHIIACGDQYNIVAWPTSVADRVCELLNRYGLADPVSVVDLQEGGGE
jgi:hypothetical protein